MKQSEKNRVEQILNAWDGAKRAEAPAFFYTRLKAKMIAQQTANETPKSWIFRPVFVVASLVLVIIINAFIYFRNDNTATPASYDETAQSITAEFFSNDNILEDINEDK